MYVVVVVESNRAPLTLAKRRILPIHAIPALEPMSYHNGFHINLFTDAVPKIMLYSTGSSRDGCDESDCMVTHPLRCALKANQTILCPPPLQIVSGSYTKLYIPLSIIIIIIIIIIIFFFFFFIIISRVKVRSRSNCGHTPSVSQAGGDQDVVTPKMEGTATYRQGRIKLFGAPGQ